jgi:hypothetical protein
MESQKDFHDERKRIKSEWMVYYAKKYASEVSHFLK